MGKGKKISDGVVCENKRHEATRQRRIKGRGKAAREADSNQIHRG
jgi:hypothetical protein